MNTPELSPCPFCGAQPKTGFHGDEDGGYHYVECLSCRRPKELEAERFIGAHGESAHDAIAAWNTRASPAPGRAPLTNEPAITWPQSRDVGRCGDMTPTGQSVLRVGMDSDNDVFVEVWDCGSRDRAEDFQIASLEFCTGGAGGGKSMRTRIALLNLMTAMEADNAETPHKAWPKVSGIAPAGGIGGEL